MSSTLQCKTMQQVLLLPNFLNCNIYIQPQPITTEATALLESSQYVCYFSYAEYNIYANCTNLYKVFSRAPMGNSFAPCLTPCWAVEYILLVVYSTYLNTFWGNKTFYIQYDQVLMNWMNNLNNSIIQHS